MNIRIDSNPPVYTIYGAGALKNPAPVASPDGASDTTATQASQTAESATWSVRNENLAAARNSLQDPAAAAKVASLIRNQIAAQPSAALAAHQLSLRSVWSLLS